MKSKQFRNSAAILLNTVFLTSALLKEDSKYATIQYFILGLSLMITIQNFVNIAFERQCPSSQASKLKGNKLVQYLIFFQMFSAQKMHKFQLKMLEPTVRPITVMGVLYLLRRIQMKNKNNHLLDLHIQLKKIF